MILIAGHLSARGEIMARFVIGFSVYDPTSGKVRRGSDALCSGGPVGCESQHCRSHAVTAARIRRQVASRVDKSSSRKEFGPSDRAWSGSG